MQPLTRLGVLGCVLLTATVGCGAPPELEHKGDPLPPVPTRAPSPSPAFPPGFTPRPTPSPSVSPTPSESPFPESTAVSCGTRTTASQVISLVKRKTSIEPNEAIKGPLCAGNWQYTILDVPGHEPVQVVTRGSLDLVVVGTQVCSVEVRVEAPAGIRTLACTD